MLHAVKPMIWQALQTLRDAKREQDSVKRTKLKVLSHNLSAEGNLPLLVQAFDDYFKESEEEIDSMRYLETLINDAVNTLKQANKEKEMKICVERVHHVCWELCRVQVTNANNGKFPELLTETSTKIWWKIFNSFSETDDDTGNTIYPVVMDWEEVDYWVNVLLKFMGLPTVSTKRNERSVMGSTKLNFHDSLLRFNQRLNHENSMYVRDEQSKPDVIYIQQSLAELNTKLFEGIYLSGTLLKVKKGGSSSAKWCVLYSLGLGFGNSPAEVDKTSSKSFIPIDANTEIKHMTDKSGKPISFQLKNEKCSTVHLFDANNTTTRNKWITSMICIKHGTAPDYLKDSIERRQNRKRNRQLEAEAKQALVEQKEQTKKKMEELTDMMNKEKKCFKEEAEKLRTASKEELQQKVSEYEAKLQNLMEQMHSLSESHEREKQAIIAQHESEREEQKRELVGQLDSVQSQLKADLQTKTDLVNELRQQNEQQQQELRRLNEEMQQQSEEAEGKIKQLEAKIAELQQQLRELNEQQLQINDSYAANKSQLQQQNEQQQQELQKLTEHLQLQSKESAERVTQLESKNADLQQQLQAATVKQQQLVTSHAAELSVMQEQVQQLQVDKQKLETDSAKVMELRQMLDEEKTNKEDAETKLERNTQELQETRKELANAVAAANSQQKKFEQHLATLQQSSKSHRGPGFDAQFK